MKGFIYKVTCTVTNKVYIGQTQRDVKVRWKEHRRHCYEKSFNNYNCKFYRAIRKYGLDSFKWEILETVVESNKDSLIKQLNYLETFYINKYNSFKKGYNMSLGGESSNIVCKEVCIYSEEGILLSKFNSVSEASELLNIPKTLIWQCCGKFTDFVIYNKQRVIFRYANDILFLQDLNKFSKNNRYKQIIMFDSAGTKLRIFNSSSEISKEFNITKDRITCNCTRRTSFVLINGIRYIFRYKGDIVTLEDLQKIQSIKSDPKMKVVAIDSNTNKILKEFSSQKEAADYFGIASHNISDVVNGKRKSAGKYNGNPIYWVKKPLI